MTLHGAVRGTKDGDYLAAGEHEERNHAVFTDLGFEKLQRTVDVSSYLLGNLRVDILYDRYVTSPTRVLRQNTRRRRILRACDVARDARPRVAGAGRLAVGLRL